MSIWYHYHTWGAIFDIANSQSDADSNSYNVRCNSGDAECSASLVATRANGLLPNPCDGAPVRLSVCMLYEWMYVCPHIQAKYPAQQQPEKPPDRCSSLTTEWLTHSQSLTQTTELLVLAIETGGCPFSRRLQYPRKTYRHSSFLSQQENDKRNFLSRILHTVYLIKEEQNSKTWVHQAQTHNYTRRHGKELINKQRHDERWAWSLWPYQFKSRR